MKIRIMSMTGVATLLLLCSASMPPASQFYYFDYENVLGTSFELKVAAASEETASMAEQVALAEIDRLSHILSTYDEGSEFSRWRKTLHEDVNVSTELFEVLALFDQWKLKTGGALSASAGIASALWKQASATQTLPSKNELNQAVADMMKSHWQLNTETQTARHLTTYPLVLNSFVKSYIMQRAAKKVMQVPGVTSSVLNIGGDILVTGEQPERILIADPKADAENGGPLSILELNNKSIATSGNYRRGFQVGKNWYSHILDVRTAMPAKDIVSATVVATNATDAGALATAFNILSPNERAELVKQIPGVEYLLITNTGQRISSTGWKELEIKLTPEISVTSSNEKVNKRDVDFELAIELELARFEGRSRRPFIAVWIENKKKETVCTVALWYNKPRWLPDLRKWYSKNYESVSKEPSNMASITSATRSAGKYTLKWDGKDSTGEYVRPGKYTIYIEAAREHGTYQLIKQEVDCKGDEPQHIDLPGGVEITSATLDYHKIEKN